MLVIAEPFAHVALDLVGTLPKTSGDHQFILVLINYATQYPEAIPLRLVRSLKVVEQLQKWISWVGLPKEIVTDQGTIFFFTRYERFVSCTAYKTPMHIHIPSPDQWTGGMKNTLQNESLKRV